MKTTTIEKIGFRYGSFTALSLILFFFVMKGVGLLEQYELRSLNIIFLFTGIFMALKAYRLKMDTAHYLGGIGVGVMTSAVALVLFSAFVMIYLDNSPLFMASLQSSEYFGRHLNPYIAGAVIFFEGTISGLLLTFILMQYYKRSHMKENEPALP